MTHVAIVDYGMCNLDSISRAVEECGGKPFVTDSRKDLEKATHIILPGVGSFTDAMQNVKARGLDVSLEEQVRGQRIPFLGICLGMQLMATHGKEGGETLGLGWIDAEVCKLQPTPADTRIPHIAWNEVNVIRKNPLFKDIESGRDFYFVHSYHMRCLKSDDVIGTTPYADGFVSAVNHEHMFGVQFHPEKSQKAGFKLLKNFLEM